MITKSKYLARTFPKGEFVEIIILEFSDVSFKTEDIKLSYYEPSVQVAMFDPKLNKNVMHQTKEGPRVAVEITDIEVSGNKVILTVTPFLAKMAVEIVLPDEQIVPLTHVTIVNEEVDRWTTATFTYEGATIDYRLFIPDQITEEIPLILGLHGSGETAEMTGKDNRSQVASSRLGLNFALPEHQKEQLCYILMPQFPSIAESFSYERYWNVYQALISQLIQIHSIDTNRLYLASLSMGARMSYKFLENEPTFFAAAFLNCGNPTDIDIVKIANIPIRLFHVKGDLAIPVECSLNVIEALVNQDVLDFEAYIMSDAFVEYADLSNAHAVWEYSLELPEITDWLFGNSKLSQKIEKEAFVQKTSFTKY